MIFVIILFIILLLVVFWQVSTLISLCGGAPYVASKKEVIRESLKLADVKPSDVFYELGSGIGIGLMIASSEFKAKAYGIEISPYHYLLSKLLTRKNKNINIIRGDFKKIDLSDADVVYCYLYPKIMQELLPKFKRELKHGTRVVSSVFKISKLKPDKVRQVSNKKIYLYRF